MAKPGYVADNSTIGLDSQQWYGNGKDSTGGQNNLLFFYDKKGIESATAKKIFSQLASTRSMPTGTGKEYRVTVFHPIYDRLPFTEATWNQLENKAFSDDFIKNGYIADRNLADVENIAYGSDGVGYPNGTYTNNGLRLLEGELACNKVTIRRSTYNAKLEKFGAMIDYTEEAVLFDEAMTVMRYREQLGEHCGQFYDDLCQLDLLATPNVMFAGVATSKSTLGTGIGIGAVTTGRATNAVEDTYRVNFEMLQQISSRLLKFRVPKKTKILTGSTNIGTTPISACYVAIVGPQLKLDIENIVRGPNDNNLSYQFVPVERYATQTTLLDGEFGRVGDFRFVCAEKMLVERGAGALVNEQAGGTSKADDYIGQLSYSTVSKAGGGTEDRFDVYPMLVVGDDAFSTISLIGKSKIEWLSKSPNQNDSMDVYGVYGYYAYKFYYASIITRPERVMRINFLASR